MFKGIFVRILITILSALMLQYTLAKGVNKQTSIYEDSIKWEDQGSKAKLLETVPEWHEDVVQSLFELYRKQEQFQLMQFADENQYNVQFINIYWGPVNNPFNKYVRPAKAFLFLDPPQKNAKSKLFYMAPLVQNSSDKNYYVFDKDQSQPILLNDWVNNLRSKQGYDWVVRFNICNAYATLPADSCTDKSYQDEITEQQKMLLPREKIPSAYRPIYEDWRITIKNNRLFNGKNSNDGIFKKSISWNDVPARNELLKTTVAWPQYSMIEENFKKIRDFSYFSDEQVSHFLRRITWLYPDDGCWTRAAAVIKDLFGPFHNIVKAYPRPAKVFAFGNLCVNTPNSSKGRVTWWYHTAPIVRDVQTNQNYVLDPSIDPYQPLAIEKWMTTIAANSGACASSNSRVGKFNICNGYGTGPFDDCQGPDVNIITELYSVRDQSIYRYLERKRQEDLGRDPDQVLGKNPPWLNG